MKITRRGTVQGGALAATGAVMGNPLRAWAQLEGSRVPTGGAHPVPSIQDAESPAQNSERMKWFREARFGMFIHWGLYAIPAGRWDGQPVGGIGEWIMNAATIPVADYKALAPKLAPSRPRKRMKAASRNLCPAGSGGRPQGSTRSMSICSNGRASHFTWTRYRALSRAPICWRTKRGLL